MAVETRPEPVKNVEEAQGGDRIAPMRADDHSDADPAVQSPIESRQGFLGRPVLMVLVGGLALAVVAWIVLQMAV